MTNTARRPFCVRAVSLTMWLQAKGFSILGTEPARDGRGIVFLFPTEAAEHANSYFTAKDTVDRLLLANQQT